MKNQKTRRSHTRRVVLSAMAVLAVSSSVLAPAFYSADLFRGITASAKTVYTDVGSDLTLYTDDSDGSSETKTLDRIKRYENWPCMAYFYEDGTIIADIKNAESADNLKLFCDSLPEWIAETYKDMEGISSARLIIPGELPVFKEGSPAFGRFYYNMYLQGMPDFSIDLVLPDATKVPDDYFSHFDSLRTVKAPNVTSIGANAFTHCMMTSITYSPNLTTIGMGAFEGCGLTSFTIPQSVTSIGARAFSDVPLATMPELPPAITTIPANLFDGCRFTSVTIPAQITKIEDCAFSGERLESITILGKLESIGKWAFGYTNNNATKIVEFKHMPKSIDPAAFQNGGNFIFRVPEKQLDDWKTLLNVTDDTTMMAGNTFAASSIKLEGVPFDDFTTEFTLKHTVESKKGYEIPDSIQDEKFEYTITPIGDAPSLGTGGVLEYNDEAKGFISTIDLTKADFTTLGDYWYEIKEKASDIANYIPDQNTYYLHIVTSNIAEPGKADNIGVTQAVLHKTYQQNVEQIKGANVTTNMTFALPKGYRNAYSEEGSLFVWNEGEDDQYQVGYYYAGDADMDFDLYAWKKETIEGALETPKSVAEKEIADGDYEEGKAPKIEEIADFPFTAVFYDDEEEFEGTAYATRTYIIDDGEGNLIEFVFWLDSEDTNAASKMEAIIASLALLPADKTDTLTGTMTPSGALTINVAATGTATSATDTFTVVTAFTFDDTIETAPKFNYTITNNGKDITEDYALTPDWENHVATLTFKDVPGGSIIKFTDLPDGISYQISESGLGDYFQNPVFTYTSDVDTTLDEDGVTTIELDAVFFGNELSDCYAKGTISDDNDAITISNTANVALDVGVFVENKPFMIILGTASVLAAGAFISRRKRVDDAAIL